MSATQGSQFPFVFAGATAAGPTAPGNTSSIASISIRASPISLKRSFGSFVRQRTRSRRIDSGVAGGSADQSGSRSRILAIESETVSPANVTRPVTISYQNTAEGPDVGSLVYGKTTRLLRAHISGSPYDGTRSQLPACTGRDLA